MTAPPLVAVEVIADDGSAGRGRVTMLTLQWRLADPFAVEVTVIAQPDHPALPRGRWVILRDFLRYGLEVPTGDGDVRIRPDVGRGQVWLDMARSGRPCSVALPMAVVRDFLDETELHVPAGTERSAEALDLLLDRLLDG